MPIFSHQITSINEKTLLVLRFSQGDYLLFQLFDSRLILLYGYISKFYIKKGKCEHVKKIVIIISKCEIFWIFF